MGNPTIIWTVAGVLAAACFGLGLKMHDGPKILEELLWYTFGAFVLAGASIIWISMEKEMLIQYKIVIGVVGAAFGALTMLTIGEFIKPTVIRTQTPSTQNSMELNSSDSLGVSSTKPNSELKAVGNEGIITQGQSGDNRITR